MKTKFVFFIVCSSIITAVYAQQSYLDSSFSGNGFITGDFNNGYADLENKLALQKDGKIVTTGYTNSAAGYDVVTVRYNTDGTLDKTFGNKGKLQTDFTSSRDYGNDIRIQQDGKILVAGYTLQSETNYDFFIARFNKNGTIDSSFNKSGHIFIDNDLKYEYYPVITLQPDGKIIIAGGTGTANTISRSFIARVNSNGTLDSSFGNNGTIEKKMGVTNNERPNAVIVLPDNTIIVGGYCQNETNNFKFCLLAFDSNGKSETNFGIQGKVLLGITGNDFLYDLAVTPDNKIIATGEMSSNFGLAKFNSNGAVDSSFGSNGIVISSVEGIPFSVVVGKNGKITMGGDSFVFTRYKPDGSLDKSFGDKGIINANFDFVNSLRTMAIQKDGRLVGGGWRTIGAESSDFFTARFLPNIQLITVASIVIPSISNSYSDLSIYPNPARDKIFLRGLSKEISYQVSITNSSGTTIQQQTSKYKPVVNLNIHSLSSGLYYVTVRTTTSITKLSFIKY